MTRATAKVDLLARQREGRPTPRACQHHAVEAHAYAHDRADSVPGALLNLGIRHGPGCIRDIRRGLADTRAEQPESAARADGFNQRRLPAATGREVFRYRGGEWKQRRGPNDVNPIPGQRGRQREPRAKERSDRNPPPAAQRHQ